MALSRHLSDEFFIKLFIMNMRLNDAIDARILNSRKVFLWGQVDDNTARHVIDRLLYLELTDPEKEIQLIINSPGGMVTSGFAIYDTMQTISSPISTICTGFAASMASILLSAGTKGRRFVLEHGRVMIHQPSGGAGGARRIGSHAGHRGYR